MQSQKQQSGNSINNISFYIKGSGTSACLLTNNLEDQPEFIPFCIENFVIQKLDMTGLYMVAMGEVKDKVSDYFEKKQQNNVFGNQNLQLQQREHGIMYENCANMDLTRRVVFWGNLNNNLVHLPKILPLSPKFHVSEISCGWNHTLLRSDNGVLLGFGQNKFGQLGVHNEKKFYEHPIELIPQQISDRFVCRVGAGFRQSYWQTDTKIIYGCGESKNNQIGQINKKQLLHITMLNVDSDSKLQFMSSVVKQICCGKKFVIVLLQSGQVYGIGSNDYQCLSDLQEIKAFDQLTVIRNKVMKIGCGWSHIVFLDRDGIVWSRGRNNFGQLGRQTISFEDRVQIASECDEISVGTQFSFAKSKKEDLYGWGWNEHMNIVNNEQQQNIKSPIMVRKPQNFELIQINTHPAITLIKGRRLI